MLTGKKTTLRLATFDDREKIYNWLAHSDITSKMMGPPDFPDNDIPTWEFFVQDYNSQFFDNNDPDNGKSFIIEAGGEEVGHINYGEIDRATNTVELDIWLRSSEYLNMGYGTDAIRAVCKYLFTKLGCQRIIIAPSGRNKDAVRAYKKCGFLETEEIPKNFVPDYYDTVILMKQK